MLANEDTSGQIASEKVDLLLAQVLRKIVNKECLISIASCAQISSWAEQSKLGHTKLTR